MTPGAQLWSEVRLSLRFCWNDISGIEEKRRLEQRGKERANKKEERERERKVQPHSLHIFSSLPERGSRSLNYWLPSQANIPACQPWFLLSFAQTPSDGAHFTLTRNRRRCENCDTLSCVQETGSVPPGLVPANTPSPQTHSLGLEMGGGAGQGCWSKIIMKGCRDLIHMSMKYQNAWVL